jgi:hypothetical protein
VAESVLGPEHSLHSKADAVLTLLLNEDLLSSEDFTAAAADKAAAAPKGEEPQVVLISVSNESCGVNSTRG